MLLDNLLGCKVVNITRVCDLVCIEFHTPKQKEISLHIQSFFRITNYKKILICSDDMYRCPSNADNDLFDWDVPGKSIYDLSLKENMSFFENATVTKYEKNHLGDLTIIFSNGTVLQILINTVEKEEKYRIFDEFETLVIES